MKKHDVPGAVGVWFCSPCAAWPSLVQVFDTAFDKAGVHMLRRFLVCCLYLTYCSEFLQQGSQK